MKTELVCNKCNKKFLRDTKEANRNKRKSQLVFCSRKCQGYNSLKNIPESSKKWDHLLKFKSGPPRDEYSMFKYVFRLAKFRAIKRNKEFNITLEYLKEIWNKQGGICPYTGWKLKLNQTSVNKLQKTLDRASLDRIDSSKGYIIGNVQFVCLAAQFAKQDFEESEFIRFCQQVTKHFNNSL